MNGFLGRLVERSLTDSAAVRPRPVSAFEPTHQLPSPDAPRALFEVEGGVTPNDPVGIDRGSAAKAGLRVPRTAPRPSGEALLKPEAREGVAAGPAPVRLAEPPRDHRGEQKQSFEAVPRLDRAMPVPVRIDLRVPAPSAPTARAAESRIAPPMPELPVEAPARRDTSVRKAPKKGATPGPVRHQLDQASIDGIGELDTIPPIGTLSAGRVQVQGRRVAPERPATDTEVSGGLLSEPVPAVRGNTLDRAPPRPLASTVTAHPDRPQGLHRDPAATPPMATLTPRLPLAEARVPSAEPAASNPAERTVHVTIGRVEIRAVPAPGAQQRTVPLEPGLTLSEYLQRRSRGGR